MSIPSSPPALPEECFNDVPSSPPLPPTPWQSRKRHADQDNSLSSDPIFSEDASEDSDINGVSKKKKYTKGPWFRPTPLGVQKTATSASRTHDSGVWLGSDSSTDSIGGCNKRVQTLSFQDFAVKRAPAKAPVAKAQKPRSPEDIAAEIVFRRVDACQETIDLEEMRLCAIPNHVLRPLHQLIRLPIDVNDSQMITPDHYAPLTPKIKLFLAKNELTRLPTELWNISNITVLSLRNNKLLELPPSLCRLRNLQELNVAGNRLKWLPWELLHLMLSPDRKLLRTSLGPNPFIQPCENRPPATGTLGRLRPSASAGDCARAIRTIRRRFSALVRLDHTYESLLLRLYETRLHQLTTNAALVQSDPSDLVLPIPDSSRPIYVASSKVAFLDLAGSHLHSPMSSFTRTEPSYVASLTPAEVPISHDTAAPSLFELSARACARSMFINQLPSLLPEDPPPPVEDALRKVMESKEVGLRRCSVCRSDYVIPRAQWIEYWYDGHGSGEQFLPFMRQACSGKCVEQLVDDRTHELAALQETSAKAQASLSEASGLD